MAEGTPDVKEARRMLAKGICIAGVGETEQGIISDGGLSPYSGAIVRDCGHTRPFRLHTCREYAPGQGLGEMSGLYRA